MVYKNPKLGNLQERRMQPAKFYNFGSALSEHILGNVEALTSVHIHAHEHTHTRTCLYKLSLFHTSIAAI